MQIKRTERERERLKERNRERKGGERDGQRKREIELKNMVIPEPINVYSSCLLQIHIKIPETILSVRFQQVTLQSHYPKDILMHYVNNDPSYVPWSIKFSLLNVFFLVMNAMFINAYLLYTLFINTFITECLVHECLITFERLNA